MLRVGVKRLPQGYGSSGDGYSRKTDEILTTSPGAPDNQDFDTIVDDVVVWNNYLEEAFFRVFIITHSNRRGMVCSPETEKCNFAKQEVEFAGIIISKYGIRPTDYR